MSDDRSDRWRRAVRVQFQFCLITAIAVMFGCGKKPNPPAVSPKKTTQKPSRSKQQQPAAGQTKGEPARSETEAAVLTAAERTRAKGLYDQHCAACHGEKGDGRAVAARFLFPKPRDFRAGNFRLVSTANGVPTPADLDAVLVRGMPGSAMPPWPNLDKPERRLLAAHLMEFRREGIRERERALAAEFDEEVDEEDLKDVVRSLTTPGPPIGVPSIGEPTAAAITSGKQLYLTKGCASCHGKEGRGNGQEKMVDAEGLPTRPRDLTMGIFKGNPDPVSVYRRTLSGMPGTPMPAAKQLTAGQVENLVHYVLSLSDEKTRNEIVLNRERIVAASVDAVAESPDDDAWNGVPAVRLRMTPLWWRDDYPSSLDVQAMHDSESVSLRLSWADETADTHAAKSESFEDAVAVELYRGDAEPFLGMGAAKSAIDVWMWDADRQSGAPDVAAINPNVVVDHYPLAETTAGTAEYQRAGTSTQAQADATLPARAAGNPIVPSPESSVATSLETAGPGTVTFRPRISQLVKAKGVWKDGRWSVVMTRPLAVDDGKSGIPLVPGERISAAFAVWNGSQRDRDGMKMITIWQDLELELPER